MATDTTWQQPTHDNSHHKATLCMTMATDKNLTTLISCDERDFGLAGTLAHTYSDSFHC